MNKIIAAILLFSPLAHSSTDMRDAPRELSSRQVAYSLSPPNGFEILNVAFNMSGAIDNEIASIEIETGQAVHIIESSQLNIDFSPNLREIRFNQIDSEDKVRPVYFNVFHGAPKRTECGVGEYEYLQKAIKISIHPNEDPVVERDSSHFSTCERLTKMGHNFGE